MPANTHSLHIPVSSGRDHIAADHPGGAIADEYGAEHVNLGILQPVSYTHLVNALLAYRTFFSVFTSGTYSLVPTKASRILHGLLWLAAGILLIVRARAKKRETLNLVLLIAALVLFPLAVCCIFLFIAPTSIHTIVLYSVVNVYFLMLLLADSCPPVTQLRRAVLNILPVLCALIVTVNIYIANESYLTLHLRYENAYAFYTSPVSYTHLPRIGIIIGGWAPRSLRPSRRKTSSSSSPTVTRKATSRAM